MSLELCPFCGLHHPGLVHEEHHEDAPMISDDAAVAIAEEETAQTEIQADAMVEVAEIEAEVHEAEIEASVDHHEAEAAVEIARIEAEAEVVETAIEAEAQVDIAEEESEVALAEVISAGEAPPEESAEIDEPEPGEIDEPDEEGEVAHVAPPPRIEPEQKKGRPTHRSAFTARHSR